MPLSKVLEKSFNSRVSGSVNFDFEIKNEGFYLIKVVARAGAWWQKFSILSEKYRDDEELHLLLDNRPIKPYFNGNSLYGTSQYLLMCQRFSIGKHTITFKGKLSPFLEALQIYECSTDGSPINILPIIDSQAEDTLVSVFISRLKRWITLVSISVPILDLSIEAQARDGWQLFFRLTDDEDIQLIIDGEIQKNGEPKAHDNRYWCGHTLKGGVKSLNKTLSKDQQTNLLGEAENQPKEAKIGIGFTVINRLKKQQSSWGFSVRDIILKENQYDGLWNKYTRDKVRDPFSEAGEKRKQEWQESYEIASDILSHKVTDTALGSTNFHSYTEAKDFPFWATDKNYRTKIGKIYFYELER